MPSNLEGGFWAREFWWGRPEGNGGWQSLPVSCGSRGAHWEGDGAGVEGQGAYDALANGVDAWMTNNVVVSSEKGLVGAENQGAMRVGRRQEMLEQGLLRGWGRVCGEGFVCQH